MKELLHGVMYSMFHLINKIVIRWEPQGTAVVPYIGNTRTKGDPLPVNFIFVLPFSDADQNIKFPPWWRYGFFAVFPRKGGVFIFLESGILMVFLQNVGLLRDRI